MTDHAHYAPLHTPAIMSSAELVVGQRFAMGSFALSKAGIIAFATSFDPQPFHLEEEAAKASIFGRLVASGLHTIAATLGLAIRNGYLNRINLAGTALDGVRWQRPTLPDQPYDVTSLVEALEPRRGGRVTMRIRYDVTGQDAEPATTMVFTQILRGPEEQPAA